RRSPSPIPPVARFDGPHCRISGFVAHGTSILAMPCSTKADSAFPVFDTMTLALSLCAHPNGQKTWSRPVSASVAGKLYMMVGSMVCALGAPPRRCGVLDEGTPRSWTVGAAPLESARIVSYAAHPDGRTLFVSGGESSFCLDTESESLGWTCQGKWVMPFKGQAYYDGELDAWVGLCRYKGGVGYLCSCDVPPAVAAATGGGGMPAWKLGKDKLFSPYNENERHLGAILLHLGNSDYCLIESLVHKDDCLSYVHGNPDWPFERCRVQRRRVFYMTRFGLKYDKNGELRTTRLRARSYGVTEGHVFNEIHSNPVAFWM
ncbi:hypothetical protein BRADI_3g47955v3, partial [Brachypodium distachyon]